MHLFCENNLPNLTKAWSGKFKGLDTGKESYEISHDKWKEIGQETVDSVKHIPASFVGRLGNVADDSGNYTAESWAFWFMYIAPYVMHERFSSEKYYIHMCQLVDIMKTTLQFTLKRSELPKLRATIIDWVKKYEEYYYQYKSERLSFCLLVVHGLLHLVDDIEYAGPMWATWTFYIERFCGFLKSAMKSRRYPWANLNNKAINLAYLEQLNVRYDLQNELGLLKKDSSKPTKFERLYPKYPQTMLGAPHQQIYEPDNNVRRLIAVYLQALVGGSVSSIQRLLPKSMSTWGKVRILPRGDTIHCSHSGHKERDSSYVRYEFLDTQSGKRMIYYGQLEQIIVCQLSNDRQLWDQYANQTILLALLTPCQTHGRDATEELTWYTTYLKPRILDIKAIQCVVGRVYSRNKWGIIDRSDDQARTLFVDTEVEGGLDSDSDSE
ncbi:uncharacterized protein B0H18DRAFT_1163387 [Fomitopsis serialis]|uniref:uncharacterized protein n=1 Tax=Fomitopsis serialis TaxID=139415 RepID=UPI002008BD7F|nr:uncharacterized protein B0H18DRAFT_1163387 [Neoantrodia serialis]KAH9911718.1 hypothetical protein B0H18DRAFT_1163387 [Neoantrodia serialis]